LLLHFPLSTPTLHDADRSNSIQVDQNDAWVEFPRAVDFHLVAIASAPIEAATIEYGVHALECGQVTAIATPSFDPGTSIDLTWRWEVSSSRVVPPGGEVWWRWQLRTADGEEITTPTRTISFEDDWFVWQTVEEDNLRIHWYRGPRSMAEELLAAGHEGLEQLAIDTGVRLEEPVDIYLYEEPLDLRRSIPGAPAWVGGLAFPEYSTILVAVNETYLEQGRRTVRHELGHLVITRMTFNCLTNLPVWLSEGLAMVAEGEEDARIAEELQEAVAQDRLLTLQQIESAFSVHANRATLSYAQSYSLVRFLIDTYGQEKMLALLETFREGVTPEEALMRTYGFDAFELENAWRAALGAPPIPATGEEERRETATPVPTLALPTMPATIAPSSPTSVPSPTPTPPAVAGRPFPTGVWVLAAGVILLLAAGIVILRQLRR
jgi:hypothetical protein